MENNDKVNSRMSRVIATPDNMPSDEELKRQAQHQSFVVKPDGDTPKQRLVQMYNGLVETIKKAQWAGAQVNLDMSFLAGLISNCVAVADHSEKVAQECQTIKAVIGKILADNPELAEEVADDGES